MKVSAEIDNNFGYEKITQLVDNIHLRYKVYVFLQSGLGRFLVVSMLLDPTAELIEPPGSQ